MWHPNSYHDLLFGPLVRYLPPHREGGDRQRCTGKCSGKTAWALEDLCLKRSIPGHELRWSSLGYSQMDGMLVVSGWPGGLNSIPEDSPPSGPAMYVQPFGQ